MLYLVCLLYTSVFDFLVDGIVFFFHTVEPLGHLIKLLIVFFLIQGHSGIILNRLLHELRYGFHLRIELVSFNLQFVCAEMCIRDSSQPWEEGILIRIPIEKMKEWNNSNPSIYSADSKEHKAIKKLDNAQLTFHSVAYTNADSKEFGEQEILKCGDKDNMQFNDIHRYRELAGYIKDMAWSYEKEIRLRVDAPDIETYDAVMLDIPQDIIDSFHFVTGPRFAGNLLSIIRKIDPKFSSERITSSLFTGRLNWVYCDSCSKNRHEK